MTIGIDMGTGSAGSPVLLDLEELLATRLLVQGNSGSGKSHLLRRLLEQSAPHVQQCVIDPEGDFVTLADRFGHVVVEADCAEADLARIASRIRRHRVSCVLDLEGLDAENQMRAAAAFLGGMFDADRDFWFPVLVVVDEAQLFAPSAAGEVADDARKLSLGAMTNLMCRGRKRGLAGVIATQRLAKLAKNVAAEASNFLMGRTFLDIDMMRAADLLGMERRQAEMFRDLERGQFVALGPALSRRPLPCRIGPVETAARSTSPRLLPLPETPADAEALIFAPPSEAELARPKPAPRQPARPVDLMERLEAAQALVRDAPDTRLDPGMKRRHEAVVAEILAEPDAGFRNDAVLYQDFVVRCRIHRIEGEAPSLPAFRRMLSVVRATGGEAIPDHPAWEEALAMSESLPGDLQGVFLMLVRAVLDEAPCPNDADIARAYGTHSERRARKVVDFLEEQGLVLRRADLRGRVMLELPWLSARSQHPQAAE